MYLYKHIYIPYAYSASESEINMIVKKHRDSSGIYAICNAVYTILSLLVEDIGNIIIIIHPDYIRVTLYPSHMIYNCLAGMFLPSPLHPHVCWYGAYYWLYPMARSQFHWLIITFPIKWVYILQRYYQ